MPPPSDHLPGLGPRWRAVGPGIWTVEGDQIRFLGDLIENHDPRSLNRLHRWFAAANRVLAPRGSTARFLRPTFWRRRRVRKVLREVLTWEPQMVILVHGPCIEDHAVEFLRDSLGWALGD